MRVAKGLVALGNRDYERAGKEFGMVGEDGGLGAWEGQVSICPPATLRAIEENAHPDECSSLGHLDLRCLPHHSPLRPREWIKRHCPT